MSNKMWRSGRAAGWPDAKQERCRSGKLLLSDVFAETMRAHPESRFGMINAKAGSCPPRRVREGGATRCIA